ncbi:MAG: Type 1 glutamine amidotransferase-like domain-containing protein [Candidatus Saccharimonadales bacterium]
MKLYLSSYKLGNHTAEFKDLVGKQNAKVAVIDNALDFSEDLERKRKSLESEFNDIKSLGFSPEHLDLREYFNDEDGLVNKLRDFDVVWVRGGNAFILMKAMKQSGFDKVIEKLIKTNKLVYSGYSAALCVISPTLDGVELVDDVNAKATGYKDEVILDGYELIDFYPIVHYKSDHPESELVEKELEYVKSKGRAYKTLQDGEVYIVNN